MDLDIPILAPITTLDPGLLRFELGPIVDLGIALGCALILAATLRGAHPIGESRAPRVARWIPPAVAVIGIAHLVRLGSAGSESAVMAGVASTLFILSWGALVVLVWAGSREGLPRRSSADEVDAALREETDRRARAERTLASRERELAAALEAAEAVNRAKREFLANMSHEVRTPLNAVIGLSENLLATRLEKHQRDQLETILDAGEQLLRVVDDILDLSTTETGRVTVERVEFNLEDAVGDTLRSFASLAARKDIELACQIAPDVPRLLVGDAGRLRQVITHLVTNAITYTEKGEVIVRVQRDSIERPLFLRFSVEDTGTGIEPTIIQRLFESFQQADLSTTRAHGGTGLGLSICRGLVQFLGGQMNAVSTLGEGSTFFFTARFEAIEARPEIAAPSALIAGCRILVVDDNATHRFILKTLLRQRQMEPLEAASAEEGLGVLDESVAAGVPIPLVLTDLHMPVRDGYQFVEEIRERSDLDDVKIVMLTSGGPSSDLERCAKLRIAARVMKPAKEHELLGVIARVMSPSPGDAPIEAPDPGARAVESARVGEVQQEPEPSWAMPGKRVLVVEDSPANQKVALAILRAEGHDVTVAQDGQEAVALIGSTPFDLVLMDIQMPLMDGFESTRAIRAMEAESGGHIPIVAMTAHALEGDCERCLAAGMDDYLTKPIRRSEVARAIANAEGIASSRLDWTAALREVGGDRTLLRELAESHLEELREQLALLPECITSQSWGEARRRIRIVQRSLDCFGAVAVGEAATRLLRAVDGQDPEAIDLVHALHRSAKPVLVELRGVVGEGRAPA